MENCLVTKLKAVVENDHLAAMDELLLVVPKNANCFVRIDNRALDGHFATFTLPDVNDVYFCSSESYSDNLGKTRESGDYVFIHNGTNNDVLMKMNHRQQISKLFSYGHQDGVQLDTLFQDGEFLQYLPYLTYIHYKQGSLLSKYIAKCSAVTTLDLLQNKENIYLNDIKGITTLSSISLWGCPIVGDISLLSSLKGLTSLSVTYCTGTSGTLESLLEGLLAAGKTTDIDCFIYSNTNAITFNGSATQYNKHYIASFSNNTITVTMDGNTIGTYSGGVWNYV